MLHHDKGKVELKSDPHSQHPGCMGRPRVASISQAPSSLSVLEPLEQLRSLFFRCASISWFEVVTQWVSHLPFSASASTGLSELLLKTWALSYKVKVSKPERFFFLFKIPDLVFPQEQPLITIIVFLIISMPSYSWGIPHICHFFYTGKIFGE